VLTASPSLIGGDHGSSTLSRVGRRLPKMGPFSLSPWAAGGVPVPLARRLEFALKEQEWKLHYGLT
jgi:hypothetical protein